ncbi:MAG: hypothetical protein AB1847_04095 [bacterium]
MKKNLPLLITTFIIAVFSFWRFFLIVSLPPEDLVTITTDDAFYYMNIASHIASGHGATFDGINKTNGFHPLWQLMLIPVYRLIPSNRLLALRVTLIFQLLVFISILILTIRFTCRIYGAIALFPILIVFLFSGFSNCLLEGMETPIHLVILALIIVYMTETWSVHHPTLPKDATLGILIGLLTLARLESFLILFSCLVFMAWYRLSNKLQLLHFVVRAIRITAPVTMLVLPFLIWNKINFGHFATISSRLKSTFPHLSFKPSLFLRYPQWAALVIVTLLFFLILVFGRYFKTGQRILQEMSQPYQNASLIYCLYVLMHFSFILLFSRWEIGGWYFAPYLLVIPLSSGPVISALRKSSYSARLRPVFVFIIILGLGLDISMQCLSLRYRLNGYANSFHRPSYRAALWAKQNIPKGAVFATTDCGVFGYFSERSVIELDGIVNNFEYQEWLLKRGLKDYLFHKGVNYIRDYASLAPEKYNQFQYTIRSKIDRDFYSSISLSPSDERYRSSSFEHLSKNKCQVIWNFPRSIVHRDVEK